MIKTELLEKLKELSSFFNEEISYEDAITWFKTHGIYIVLKPVPSYASNNRVIWWWNVYANSTGDLFEINKSPYMGNIHEVNALIEALEEAINVYKEIKNEN